MAAAGPTGVTMSYDERAATWPPEFPPLRPTPEPGPPRWPGEPGWPAPAERPGVFVPMVVEPPRPPDVFARLLERRVVLVSGHLDVARATEVAAQVMLLDAEGDDPI